MCPVKIFPRRNPMIHTVTMDIIRNYMTTQTIHMGYIMKSQIMGEFLGMPTTALLQNKIAGHLRGFPTNKTSIIPYRSNCIL